MFGRVQKMKERSWMREKSMKNVINYLERKKKKKRKENEREKIILDSTIFYPFKSV